MVFPLQPFSLQFLLHIEPKHFFKNLNMILSHTARHCLVVPHCSYVQNSPHGPRAPLTSQPSLIPYSGSLVPATPVFLQCLQHFILPPASGPLHILSRIWLLVLLLTITGHLLDDFWASVETSVPGEAFPELCVSTLGFLATSSSTFSFSSWCLPWFATIR